uniref:proteinaceous RNase P 1, chloroplastic/mitochondrial-like n=1 Tax=Erigeron canadensis TaxID=72917 RepID=UPI001CB93034|nr:proteinaceous RNase P 1, chloroplastic/mitochondrial-like [Erigeron canadensis]
MAFSSTFKPQTQLRSFTLCKSPSILSSNFNNFSNLSQKKHSPLFYIQAHTTTTHSETKSSIADQHHSKPTISRRILDKIQHGLSSFDSKDENFMRKTQENGDIRHGVEAKDESFMKKSEQYGKFQHGVSSSETKDENFERKPVEIDKMVLKEKDKFSRNRLDSKKMKFNDSGEKISKDTVSDVKRFKRPKKGKFESPVTILRISLEICSKLGDVMGAIGIFDLAKKEGISLGQYHYAVILYLCSSAAVGVVQPAKSGRSDTTSNVDSENLEAQTPGLETYCQTLDGLTELIKHHENSKVRNRIKVGDNIKEYALKRGFEIYEEMVSDEVPMNEAILTSLARMAMSRNDGEMAFEMVKQMKDLGINPRLRSYGPALSVFCNNGNLEKAFEIEEHMLSHGVYPEEPELELLLRVSIEANRSDKVYYLLHKLRTSVRKVLPSTADVIEKWFTSKGATRIGKRKWDQHEISEAIENGGGGWHGQGWLGNGKWNVLRSSVGKDGSCSCCGEKLVTIDLDPIETEKFAESVAEIAKQRDRHSSFKKFQKWLDYYGPFEAVVDGANVGLFSQRRFKPSKVNTIANGIRQILPSKKYPLIILHNRRITGDKMEDGLNKTLIEKWKTADSLYATPTGSNDDWYWLYAAIKFKCLLVTNDEMRDHLFQLLGNDFFPKWKERHQVRFHFSEMGPVYHMPPPCSVVIQESRTGHWHIPIASEQDSEEERVWLCVTRDKSSKDNQKSINGTKGRKGISGSDFETEVQLNAPLAKDQNHGSHKRTSQEIKQTLSSSPVNQCATLTRIAAAEKLGDCVLDFQI